MCWPAVLFQVPSGTCGSRASSCPVPHVAPPALTPAQHHRVCAFPCSTESFSLFSARPPHSVERSLLCLGRPHAGSLGSVLFCPFSLSSGLFSCPVSGSRSVYSIILLLLLSLCSLSQVPLSLRWSLFLAVPGTLSPPGTLPDSAHSFLFYFLWFSLYLVQSLWPSLSLPQRSKLRRCFTEEDREWHKFWMRIY